MKANDYFKLEDLIKEAQGSLGMAYESIDTSEDFDWSNRFNNLMTELDCLLEEMIYTFTIEDVNQEVYKELQERGRE